jgi:hypothetical protein
MTTKRFFIVLLLFFSMNVFAEEMPFVAFETEALNLVVNNDATGIVRDVWCEGCDFKIVKITRKSKATIDGKEVSIFAAKRRAGKRAMVSFNPKTREVQYIRWSE